RVGGGVGLARGDARRRGGVVRGIVGGDCGVVGRSAGGGRGVGGGGLGVRGRVVGGRGRGLACVVGGRPVLVLSLVGTGDERQAGGGDGDDQGKAHSGLQGKAAPHERGAGPLNARRSF